jgi:diphthine-ammonia ligase
MKLAVLFSGGKDSCLALHKAKKEGHDVKYLLSIIPKNFDSYMFHKPYLRLLERQAKMLNIDLVIMESEGIKDEEVEDLKELIECFKDKVEGIVVGGIASSYQGDRIKRICSELDLEFIATLWDYSPEKIWEELLNKKFKVILTKIACEGIPKEFLGKIIDKKLFIELKKLSEKYKFRLDFEGGEAESAVLYMPDFKKDIEVKYNARSEGEYRHYLDIREVI